MSQYTDTLEFLYNRLPMFSKIGADAYKKDLYNIRELCKRLNNPQHHFKTIHIAGTNGKGSTSHMLAAILQHAGYKTGLYTSPHLEDFRERIRINGKMIPEQHVIDFTEQTKDWYDEIEPSFFEITVAMAFDYFAKENVEIAVIETGLGGRLDSTNIILPELSVITNIGWDHMNILGDTLEKIASEKAGIIKPNVPVIIGETSNITSPVFIQKSSQENSSIVFADQQVTISSWKYDKQHKLDIVLSEHNRTTALSLDLPGLYQLKNIPAVWMAVRQLQKQGWKIEDQIAIDALAQVRKLTHLHGRWEIIQTDPMLVLDVGHNVDGINQILYQLEHTNHAKLHVVIGMVKDKDIRKVLTLLPKQAKYYFTQSNIPRAMPVDQFATLAESNGLKGSTHEDVNLAIVAAKANASKDDLILVCGSVFLIGEVKRN
ncbi:MAG: bifunctional folylpolyglutamate synthase/dihydrofolate synthase [Sphingobacteriales bacterium]|jgi:dihydrofolate synthase/folylpolyglutamate synthase